MQLSSYLDTLKKDIDLYGFIKFGYTYSKALNDNQKITAGFIGATGTFNVLVANRRYGLLNPSAGLMWTLPYFIFDSQLQR